ncbi:BRO-N domain-containing protein [Candidatus Pantoea bituminis]|uniref:BRO-N domain-containing protein n=1 Tax=Candidatus Pantoea bituminis TaxID=2831036 RepID=UPI001C061447|nr:BRO family protein [Pantoea bituminis]
MDKNLMQLCYEGDCGDSYIRSINDNGQLYVSLSDVIRTLSAENRKMDGRPTARMATLLQAVVATLDDDEFKNLPLVVEGATISETFLAEPGLYRVLAQDITPAGKKFQRWLFHKVLPSIREFGIYPPPIVKGRSEISTLANSLQQAVTLFAMEVERREALESRVEEVELKVNSIASLRDLSKFRTVSQRLLELELEGLSVDELWHWCEKLRCERGLEKIKCPSNIPLNAHYPISLVDEAINTYQQNLADRAK